MISLSKFIVSLANINNLFISYTFYFISQTLAVIIHWYCYQWSYNISSIYNTSFLPLSTLLLRSV